MYYYMVELESRTNCYFRDGLKKHQLITSSPPSSCSGYYSLIIRYLQFYETSIQKLNKFLNL